MPRGRRDGGGRVGNDSGIRIARDISVAMDCWRRASTPWVFAFVRVTAARGAFQGSTTTEATSDAAFRAAGSKAHQIIGTTPSSAAAALTAKPCVTL